jgi:hypothetical protein
MEIQYSTQLGHQSLFWCCYYKVCCTLLCTSKAYNKTLIYITNIVRFLDKEGVKRNQRYRSARSYLSRPMLLVTTAAIPGFSYEQ